MRLYPASAPAGRARSPATSPSSLCLMPRSRGWASRSMTGSPSCRASAAGSRTPDARSRAPARGRPRRVDGAFAGVAGRVERRPAGRRRPRRARCATPRAAPTAPDPRDDRRSRARGSSPPAASRSAGPTGWPSSTGWLTFLIPRAAVALARRAAAAHAARCVRTGPRRSATPARRSRAHPRRTRRLQTCPTAGAARYTPRSVRRSRRGRSRPALLAALARATPASSSERGRRSRGRRRGDALGRVTPPPTSTSRSPRSA